MAAAKDGLGSGATVMWNWSCAAAPLASVAFQVYRARALDTVGVPVIRWVAALRLTPSGRSGDRV